MKKIRRLSVLLLPLLLLVGCGNNSYIEIKGNSIVTHTYGVEYNDDGYNVKDKNVTVTVDNDVDINKLGEHQVTYIVLKGNREVERIVRIVKVVDDKAPVINALNEIEVFLNTDISDEKLKKSMNLTVKDNYDNVENIKVELSYEIDVTKEGEYKLNIKAKDTNNNESMKEVKVKVTKVHITKISLNKTSLNLDKGRSASLKVNYYPSNATDSKAVIWSSSNEKVAKVSKGKVSAVGIGNTKICATLKSDSGIKSCTDVKVSESQISKFKKYLVSNGYAKKNSNLYQKNHNGYIYKVNFSNKTFIMDDGEGPITYYYKNNKARYVYYYSNGAIKTVDYVFDSNKYSCSIKPSYYSQLCNNVDGAINNLKSLKKLFDLMVDAAGVKKGSL